MATLTNLFITSCFKQQIQKAIVSFLKSETCETAATQVPLSNSCWVKRKSDTSAEVANTKPSQASAKAKVEWTEEQKRKAKGALAHKPCCHTMAGCH